MGFGVSYVVLFSVMFVCAWSQDDDAAVMQKLKTLISKNNHNLDWSNNDFCLWEGIRCNGKRVTSISFNSSTVQGDLPDEEWVQLTELTDFHCSVNNLSGAFPHMPNSLQRLYINNNSFTSMPDDFFNNLTNLIEVTIDFNLFSKWQIPSSLKNCLALKKFSAMNANLVGEIPELLFGTETLSSLTDLMLSYNFLEGNLPNSLSGSTIETLWLNNQNGNKLNGTLFVLQNMTSLKEIWVQSNAFTGPIPDLSNLDQLVTVSFRDNELTGVVPSSLTSLQSLKSVILANNNLQGSYPKFGKGVTVEMNGNNFCTMDVGQPCSPLVNALLSVVEPFGYPLNLVQSWKGNDPCNGSWSGIGCSNGNITSIDFRNKGISGSISPSFASLSSLTTLLLANNNLTGTIPKELASMPALKLLDVSNNSLYGQIPLFRAVTGRVTTKVDVYSYGVILMEIITGRRALDNSEPEENMHLVTWFRRILLNKGSFEKVIDPAMDINEEGLESFKDIAGLASHCCAREPHQRPEMGQIVNVLAPLVEIWKPAEPDDDDMYGIDFDMSLPQVLSKWQNLEGTSNALDVSSSVSASYENTQSSIPPRSPRFANPYTSADAR
ncbi:hypothetical protein TSUD_12300 [Trifolium subterraneum]|uniref:Leucine-rich repeat-containing N-terminal plant-type domain-containing protein n=1 Tax=Trifolium subterraneum TaxID=3900 RepID=A0A2Z6LPI3_TRISU|nr:hypothetical protein TSUD_12300 [Trifolium subterraneum]